MTDGGGEETSSIIPNQSIFPLAGPLQKAQQRVLKPGKKLAGLFIWLASMQFVLQDVVHHGVTQRVFPAIHPHI